MRGGVRWDLGANFLSLRRLEFSVVRSAREISGDEQQQPKDLCRDTFIDAHFYTSLQHRRSFGIQMRVPMHLSELL
jgi:hypothetical protein